MNLFLQSNWCDVTNNFISLIRDLQDSYIFWFLVILAILALIYGIFTAILKSIIAFKDVIASLIDKTVVDKLIKLWEEKNIERGQRKDANISALDKLGNAINRIADTIAELFKQMESIVYTLKDISNNQLKMAELLDRTADRIDKIENNVCELRKRA